MNSNYGKSGNPQRGSFDFDLGLGSNRSTPLKDQKQQTSSYASFSSTQPKPSSAPSWQPNKPAWTHQPAPTSTNLSGVPSGPTSMVGDIFGKSWSSAAPVSSSGIGIVPKNPNLFGDLVGSALGQGKSNTNAPLKSAALAPSKSAYSMGNLGDSLPKTNNSSNSTGNWGSNLSSGYNSNDTNNKSTNLGGPSMKKVGGNGSGGGGMGSNKDPFVSLVDFGSKQSVNLNSTSKTSKNNTMDDPFLSFQNASKPSTNSSKTRETNTMDNPFGGFQNASKPSTNKTSESNTMEDPFGGFQNASKPSTNTFSSSKTSENTTMEDPFGGFQNASKGSTNTYNSNDFKMDNFGKNQPQVQTSSVDPLDTLFSSTSGSTQGATTQQFSELDDWGMESESGGGGDGGTTTELEGLPPPPAGITASSAKNKGMDNYKQGQYADAIKWLSWATLLLEKVGDADANMEVLSSRASCYKEVGEYKKAVADCTKVLEHDGKNVNVLVQRALLYESIEKYRLGAEDLRTVLKIDPGNRVARSTVHRLSKMAE